MRMIKTGMLFFTLHLLFLASSAFSAPPDKGVGLHLSKVRDFASAMPFNDIFMSSRKFVTQRTQSKEWDTKEQLQLNEDGWIEKLDIGQRALAIMIWGLREHQPSGRFILTYEGEGKLSFTDNVKIIKQKPGKLTLEITKWIGVYIVFEQINKDNPIRNLKILLPGISGKEASNVFNPEYLNLIKDFKVFRFMDWQRANKDRIETWAYRTKPTSRTQASDKGVALEYIVDLANRMNVAPWFNLHHSVSDGYIRNFANFIKNNLDPNLKFYVEFSNEVWNRIFPQNSYVNLMAKNRGMKNGDEFYFRRSMEIFRIFEEVFGGSDRIVRVIASQFWNTYRISELLKYKNPTDDFDALAIAPYFGNRIKFDRDQGIPETEVILGKMDESLDDYREQLRTVVSLAQSSGLPVIAYEGGQHLSGRICATANRNPRIGDLYDKYLSIWNEETDNSLFIHLTMANRMGRTGCFGLIEYMDDDLDDAPKYQSMMRYLKKIGQID